MGSRPPSWGTACRTRIQPKKQNTVKLGTQNDERWIKNGDFFESFLLSLKNFD